MRSVRFTVPHALAALLIGGLLLGVAVAAEDKKDAPATDVKPEDEGFVSLFDGKSLDGWKVGDKADAWKVEDGHIVVNNGPSHLFYVGPEHDHDWKNFHLKVELQTFPHANSGVYFHTKYQEHSWPDDGFECQVNCTHSDWKKTGSLYDVQDIKDPHHKDNEWFTYDIIVKGDHVVLKINDEVVNDWTQPDGFKPPAGHPGRFIHHGTFALQGHDPKSQTWFRSIKVKALED